MLNLKFFCDKIILKTVKYTGKIKSAVIMLTKVEAIKSVMQEYNGIATLQMIYNDIEKYYPNAKKSKEWEAGIRGVLYRDLGKTFKKIDEATYALLDYDTTNLLPVNYRVGVTEKEVLAKVRTLQHKYRDLLLKQLKYCPLTRVTDQRLLIASHIKPWCFSNDREKLDIYNGFILTPLYDKLFDRGLITFTKEKEMIISPSLSKSTISKLCLKEGKYEYLPVEGREEYLKFHNDKIFINY